jgi:hypothetical protein
MQTAISSKILVPINQTTHFHVPEQGSHYIWLLWELQISQSSMLYH